MKHTSTHCLGIFLLSFTISNFNYAQAAAAYPNFLLIIADDCTWSDLGCYGGQAKTPTLDQLQQEGMTFQKCFQAAPMCSPTRHCLYTGIYPVKSGAHPNHTFVRPGTKSIGHYLQEAGYRVALSGKRHIAPPESFPFEYSETPTERKRERNPHFPKVNEFLKECHEQHTPFCLFVCSTEPHTPYTHGNPAQYELDKIQLPPHYVDTPATRELFRKYLAEITYFDSQVARTLELLDEHQHSENTLVIVLSEQGNSFPFAKWTCYDAGLQSGMLARWPRRIAPNSTTNAMVEYVDIIPTFLNAAGIEIPAIIDGRSFLPLLLNQNNRHKEYSFAIQTSRGIYSGPEHYGIRSVRSDKFRYVRNLTPSAQFHNTVFNTQWWKGWKELAAMGNNHADHVTSRYASRPAEELFDCENDPWNINNLANDPKYASTKGKLSKELDRWMTQQGDLGQQTEMNAKYRQWNYSRQEPAIPNE